MTAYTEDDLNDDQFEFSMEALERSVVQYTRVIGSQLHLSETTQNACMKRALMTALLNMIEHEPCNLARSEIIEDLEGLWKRRTECMLKRPATEQTTH
jgi:hypothetical protein